MTLWTDVELAAIGSDEELKLSTRRADGSWSGDTSIWVVRVDAGLFIRSYRGPAGGWYQRARRTGATETELIEAITHMAFYCGWPKAMSAMSVVKRVFAADAA